LDLGAILDLEQGAVGHHVADLGDAVLVDQGHFAGAADHHVLALPVGDRFHVAEHDLAIPLGLLDRFGGHARGRAADMEGAQGELRAGFADGLGGHNADGFPDIDHAAVGQITTVALGADASQGFAGKHGAHLDAFDAGLADLLGHDFVEKLAGVADDRVADWVVHVVAGHAPENLVGERDHDVVAFRGVGHVEPEHGAAILFVHDHVLRHVHQAAGKVAGIGGLERRIGQTLAGAVGGDEVLQHVQAFAEAGENRVLDDFVSGDLLLGLGHEAAHAGKLLDLLAGTAGAGYGHHVNGVESVAILGQLFVHQGRHVVGGVRPEIDDLVVALAVGDDAVLVQLGDFIDLDLGSLDHLVLLRGDDHVADGHGHAAPGRPLEPEVLDGVQEHASALVAGDAEIPIDGGGYG